MRVGYLIHYLAATGLCELSGTGKNAAKEAISLACKNVMSTDPQFTQVTFKA